MAVNFTDYLNNKLLDHIRGGTAFTQPSGLYVKLHVGSPGAAGAGNPAANTTRHQATFGSVASAGAIANTVALTWTTGEVTTTETYSYVSLWDASSAGNCLATGTLSPGAAATAGVAFALAIGAVTVSMPDAS